MKRLIIVVEGQTEQEFVKTVLAPYLIEKYSIYDISARLIGKPGHKGGDVRYSRLKTDINILLKEKNVVVTTFIDFFKLNNDFPAFDESLKLSDAYSKINHIEQAMIRDINNPSFIPYIQCHEFEALLFSSLKGFEKYFTSNTVRRLKEVVDLFPNPENINNNQPPSYRLIDVSSSSEKAKYDKVVYGNIIALENGLDEAIACCPRFAKWILDISKAATE